VPVEAALRDAKLDLNDLNEVILVGGSTRIPAVIDLVRLPAHPVARWQPVGSGSQAHHKGCGSIPFYMR
jgi:Hsp70 protein